MQKTLCVVALTRFYNAVRKLLVVANMSKTGLVLVLFSMICCNIEVQAQSWGSRRQRPQFGISTAAGWPSGSSGIVSDGFTAMPHREVVYGLGLVWQKPLASGLELSIAPAFFREQSHFHLLSSSPDRPFGQGDYTRTYYHLPILINHLSRRAWTNRGGFKEFFGVAFNVDRQSNSSGTLDESPFAFSTRAYNINRVSPEFVIGAGFVSRRTFAGVIHLQTMICLNMLEDQVYSYSIEQGPDLLPISGSYQFRGFRAFAQLMYFPRLPQRRQKCYRQGF